MAIKKQLKERSLTSHPLFIKEMLALIKVNVEALNHIKIGDREKSTFLKSFAEAETFFLNIKTKF